MVISQQLRLPNKPKTKRHNFLNLLQAYLCRAKNTFIYRYVRFTNKGYFKPASPFYFDNFVNRLTCASSNRGFVDIKESNSVVTGKKLNSSGGWRLYVTGHLRQHLYQP